jgi:hypothetical protein
MRLAYYRLLRGLRMLQRSNVRADHAVRGTHKRGASWWFEVRPGIEAAPAGQAVLHLAELCGAPQEKPKLF